MILSSGGSDVVLVCLCVCVCVKSSVAYVWDHIPDPLGWREAMPVDSTMQNATSKSMHMVEHA